MLWTGLEHQSCDMAGKIEEGVCILDGELKRNFSRAPLIIDAFDLPEHKYSYDFALGGL